MILSQLINPEDLARLDQAQVNTLSAVIFTQIIASDEIKRTLQKPVRDALSRLQKDEQANPGGSLGKRTSSRKA